MTTTLASDHRVDWNDLELEVKALSVNGASITSTNSAYLTSITPGTAAASKALVLNSSLGIATITSATITTLTAPTIAGATEFTGAVLADTTLHVVGAVTNDSTLTQTGVATFGANPTFAAGKTIKLDSNTATCSSNAATLTKYACVVTSESLSTAHTASQALALTLSGVAAGDFAIVNLVGGSNTGGIPLLKAVCTTNTVTVTISNMAKATDAFNGTFIFNLWVLKL